MTNRKQPIFNLDQEEQALSNSFDSVEWRSVKNLNKEFDKAHEAAANYLRKVRALIFAFHQVI